MGHYIANRYTCIHKCMFCVCVYLYAAHMYMYVHMCLCVYYTVYVDVCADIKLCVCVL